MHLTNGLHARYSEHTMKHIIQFRITKGEKAYVAESIDLPVVTQGKTLDDVIRNIHEAVQLHLEGEDLRSLELAAHPSVMVNFELASVYA